MVRKLLKVDLARALDLSSSIVSRYCARGMPTHDVELARRWCDAHLVPSLRKEVRREGRLPPADDQAAGRGPVFSLDDLAQLLEDAGERIAASLAYELDVDVERAAVGVNALACALDALLDERGIVSDLWNVMGPRVGDPVIRARIEALVESTRAAGGE